MVHHATIRAVSRSVRALGTPVDIGFVFPAKLGDDRGFGRWTNHDLTIEEVMALLPRAASANARNGNIYMRVGPAAKMAHPGIVMLDDLTADAVTQLDRDGLQPCLTIETSAGNFQCWLRLLETGTADYATVNAVIRHLAAEYGADPRAVSPRQPGRLPGFTNRKPKHRREDGNFPFVTITDVRIGQIAGGGMALLRKFAATGTGRAAPGAPPEKPPMAAEVSAADVSDFGAMLELYREQQSRVAQQAASGHRPASAASASEVDFGFAVAAIDGGWDMAEVRAFILTVRPNKSSPYAHRTVAAAVRLLESRYSSTQSTPQVDDSEAAMDLLSEANLP